MKYVLNDSAFTSSTIMGGTDLDGKAASWEVSYANNGKRVYEVSNGLTSLFSNPLDDFTLAQTPTWKLEAAASKYGDDNNNVAGASGANGYINWIDWTSYSQNSGSNSYGYGNAAGLRGAFAAVATSAGKQQTAPP